MILDSFNITPAQGVGTAPVSQPTFTGANRITLLKQRWQSRTYRAGLLMALLSVLEVQSGFISQFLPPQYRPALIAAWPLVMFFCREITTSALADK